MAEYTTDALAAGQWVEYVGEGSPEQLRRELLGLDGIRDAVQERRVGIVNPGDFYEFADDGVAVDPVKSVEASVKATERALAAGYTGFRAVVDATAVARTERQREAFARFEYLIDRKMSTLPISALCAYDAGELGDAAVAELACLHPLASVGSTSFHLYADEDVDFAVAGDIDLAYHRTFATTLTRVVPQAAELVVQAHRLDFVDHRALVMLAEQAGRVGATVTLRADRPSPTARLVELLDRPGLRVEEGV